MKEDNRLSGGILVLGILVLFQRMTQMNLDFFTLLFFSAMTTLWAYYQQERKGARLFQAIFMLLIILVVLGIYSPLSLPAVLGTSWVYSTWQIQWQLLENQGLIGFFQEIYAYATDPNKLDFSHWQYLAILGGLILSEGLVRLHRLKQGEWVYLFLVALTGLLWFTYLDVWLPFACLFIAYGTKRFTEQGKGLVFGLAVPLFVTVIAILLTTITPVDWINTQTSEWRNTSGFFRTSADLSKGSSEFELRALGFYPLKDRLGGPVTLSKDVLFKIKTQEKGLYLRGRVLTHYKNNSWREEDRKNVSFKPVSLLSGRKIQYTIYDFKEPLSTLLAPLSVTSVDIPSKKLFQTSDQIVRYKGNLTEDYKQGITLEGYDYASTVLKEQSIYLQLPSNYSPEVTSLTKQVVEGATSDKEKVERIQRYLLEHYKYQLAVEVPPKDQDFVHYFLTQSDSGYCVYFASAATLMARISGVPSRYVEGFITPTEIFENRDTPISGERAHAWAEVYYDGKWRVLETTPTFTTLPSEGENLSQTLDNQEAALPLGQKTNSEDDMPQTLPLPTDEDALFNEFWTLPGLILVGIGLVLLWLMQSMKSFLRLDCREKQKEYVLFLLKGLCELFELLEAKTLSVRDIFAISQSHTLRTELGGLVEIVEKSLYDSKGCSKEECEMLEKAYWTLYHKDFNTAMKLKWAYKIARKGRIFYGFNGKNSTAQH